MSSEKIQILDGGMATSLEAKGFDLSGSLWSARVLVDDPMAIRDVHVEHAVAGADVVTSASYQASRSGFVKAGLTEDDYLRALELSLILAHSAADEVSSEQKRQIKVAASVGPFGATLADGSEYRGDYGVTEEFLIDFHGERLRDIEQHEPDLLAIETVPSIIELRAINKLLSNDFRHLSAWVSCSGRDESTISDGTTFKNVLEILSAPNIVARGINCTKPELINGLLQSAGGIGPFVVYSNAGRTWDAENRVWLDAGSLTIPDGTVSQWIDNGATMIGGCCGLGVEHISALSALIRS